MIQSGFQASAEPVLDSQDFDKQYQFVKRLIQELKEENHSSLRKELFGEEDQRPLSKKQLKELFRVLRKIERQCQECYAAPIPDELEGAIRSRDESAWLPWELEAIEKIDAWREEIQERKKQTRQMLTVALEKIRKGEKPA